MPEFMIQPNDAARMPFLKGSEPIAVIITATTIELMIKIANTSRSITDVISGIPLTTRRAIIPFKALVG
ncbi:MAG: hypothetical protein RBG13Loki_1638 [Promethearchaeota archaeon CR_4]|nr:MAG: hypothetical protein RBG13Loki_1638 [Candidatus Lokiarchaeota archaeon CR_4]